MTFFLMKLSKKTWCVGVCTHVGEQAADGLNISSCKHIAELVHHRQTQGVNSDSPFACQSHTHTDQSGMMWKNEADASQ